MAPWSGRREGEGETIDKGAPIHWATGLTGEKRDVGKQEWF